MSTTGRGTRHLFTFIFEYAGGTYISQYRGRAHNEAFRTWLRKEPAKLEPLVKERLVDRLDMDTLVALSALQHVWCSTALLPKGLALLNMIKTIA